MTINQISINALSLMYSTGFYYENRTLGKPVFNKLSLNRFLELLNLLKK